MNQQQPITPIFTITVAHVLLTSVAALASPVFGGNLNVAFGVLVFGGLAVFLAVAIMASRGPDPSGRAIRVFFGIALALGVSVVSMLVSYGFLVGILEELGYGK